MPNRIKLAVQFMMLCSFAVVALALQPFSLDANTDQVAEVVVDGATASALMSVPSDAVAASVSEQAPPTGPKFVCNQGAYCTSRRDSACGIEGYCNLASNCCMCY